MIIQRSYDSESSKATESKLRTTLWLIFRSLSNKESQGTSHNAVVSRPLDWKLKQMPSRLLLWFELQFEVWKDGSSSFVDSYSREKIRTTRTTTYNHHIIPGYSTQFVHRIQGTMLRCRSADLHTRVKFTYARDNEKK